MNEQKLKNIIEAALFAAGGTLTLERIISLFPEGEERPTQDEVNKALAALVAEWEGKGVELQEVASGYRFQVRAEMAPWISRLWEEKPPRYSRALLETLALVAYRQPITRAEIEDIRGVSVSTNIVKTLQEREWIRVVGHRDVPGRPAMYGTTRQFLDYFNLKSLDQLPTLAELRDIDSINAELDLDLPGVGSAKPVTAAASEVGAAESEEYGPEEAGTAEGAVSAGVPDAPSAPDSGTDAYEEAPMAAETAAQAAEDETARREDVTTIGEHETGAPETEVEEDSTDTGEPT